MHVAIASQYTDSGSGDSRLCLFYYSMYGVGNKGRRKADRQAHRMILAAFPGKYHWGGCESVRAAMMASTTSTGSYRQTDRAREVDREVVR
mgnify:CR=1 FL=1